MDTVSLAAKTRTETGSGKAGALRRSGKIPAILYGHGMKPLCLEMDKKEMIHVLHTKAGTNVMVSLKVAGAKLKESTCRIKEIQYHPVSEEIQHVDFTVVSMSEKIEVKVPLIVKGMEDAPGVKEGGVLETIHHELLIECLPTQIPEKFEYDVKDMNIQDVIHVKDLKMPSELTCKLDPDEAIIALHPPKKEEEPVPEEGEMTEPEVIEKGKKVEEEEGVAPAEGGEAKPKPKPEAEGKKEGKKE